eukprot:727124_1
MTAPQTVIVVQPTQPTIALSEINDGASTASHYAKRKRTSSIGQENLAERSCSEKFTNFIGILLSIASIVLEIIQLTKYREYGCDQFGFISSIVLACLASISLIINVVDYKTGDCECLRNCIMCCVCLWPIKYCCFQFYEKVSLKLLMMINFILWVILFSFDLAELLNEDTPNCDGEEDDAITNGQKTILYIEMGASVFGLGISIIVFVFKLFAKMLQSVRAKRCVIFGGILLIAVAAVVVLYITKVISIDGFNIKINNI